MDRRDKALVVSGEDQWFEALWAEYAGYIYSYAARRVGPDAAPDIVSDTFSVVWRRGSEIPTSALPWLYGVARKVISQHNRGEIRYNRLMDRAARVPLSGVSSVESLVVERDSLGAALRSLDEGDLEALLLVAWEGLSNQEAALVMGYSESAFRVRLSRARRRLRKQIEGSEGSAYGGISHE